MVPLPHVPDDGVCVIDAFLGPPKVIEDPCETSVRLKRLSPEGVTTFDKENTEDSDAPIQYRIMLRGHFLGKAQTTTETPTLPSRLEEEKVLHTLFSYISWLMFTSLVWQAISTSIEKYHP